MLFFIGFYFNRNQMILEMLSALEAIYRQTFNGSEIYRQVDILQEGVKAKKYQSLMSRTKCSELIR